MKHVGTDSSECVLNANFQGFKGFYRESLMAYISVLSIIVIIIELILGLSILGGIEE